MSTPDTAKPGRLRRVLFVLKLVEIRLRFVLLLVLTGIGVGYWDTIVNYWERWERHRHPADASSAIAGAVESRYQFFCPMHPFVVRERQGSCPVCGMALVQREKGVATTLPAGVLARVQASPERVLQAGVQVEPVTYRLLSRLVRSYGTVEPAETATARIIARFPGRIEALLVNTVGQVVEKGQPLARLYSPKFLAATQEYVQALSAQRQTDTDQRAGPEEKRRAAEVARYARQRLALAGFTPAQLEAIEKTGTAEEFVTLASPLAGTVLERGVLLGDMVEEGTALYTVADLSTLWVQVQVIESEIAAVRVGMPVEVTAVAYPGRIFYGTVDFVYPTVSTELRSAKVRVVVDGRGGELKPGMYVTATLRSPVGRYGRIGTADEPKVDPGEAAAVEPGPDVYWCPMHHEVTSATPGAECPTCGMKLELKPREMQPTAASSLASRWAEGFTCAMHPDLLSATGGTCTVCGCGMELTRWRVERVPAIPETAVIDTGSRQVVYVEVSPGVFDAKAVTLGGRCGVYYPVLAGLSMGERVAARGAFLIDSEARLNPAPVPEPPDDH